MLGAVTCGRGEGVDHALRLGGVSVLLEGGYLAVVDVPEVGELRVDGFLAGLVGSGIACRDDDGVAGVKISSGSDWNLSQSVAYREKIPSATAPGPL